MPTINEILITTDMLLVEQYNLNIGYEYDNNSTIILFKDYDKNSRLLINDKQKNNLFKIDLEEGKWKIQSNVTFKDGTYYGQILQRVSDTFEKRSPIFKITVKNSLPL